LGILRKHSVVHHGQSTGAKFKKFPDLSGTILELNNSSSAILASPEITTTLSGKPEKNLNSRVNALILSNNINKGT
jgi:hypothetical protein